MNAVDLRSLSIFDGVTDEQLAELFEAGTEVLVKPGAELFREGEHADFWWLLVEGAIELTRHIGRDETVVGRMDVPGRWAGGFRAWDEHGVYLATGRGTTSGRVLRVPAEALRVLSHAWFPFGAHLIEGLYRTARTIEATARQRESLLMLGTLAAGLAHEMNNPAAAATRAADALERVSATLLSSLTRLATNQISAQQFAALDALRQQIAPQSPVLDPLAFADHEQALSQWLIRHGVEHPWAIASSLAAAGVEVAWCEQAAAVLGTRPLEPGLEWVASTLSTKSLLAEVKESTRRVSELVAAVKSHSQMDRGPMQRIDVTDGLESSLTMLVYKLRGGVTVVRNYGHGLPEIEAYPGELNQAWVNLIDNAIDAMDSIGQLTLTTRADGDSVVVEVGDTGPGFPPHVAARAFEAFYTTKDVGKGTGLGLDITRRIIVERHGGTIDIDSQPGSTVLRVRLPVQPPA